MPRTGFSARLMLLIAALALVGLLVALPWAGGSPAGAQDGQEKVPVRPTGLGVSTEAGSLEVALSWNAVDGATSYKVRWRRSGPGNALNEGVTAQSPSAAITVSDYGRWVVRVEGCNDAGCGPGAAKTALIRQAKPDRPQNLTVTTGTGSLDLAVTWDAAKRAISYKLRWRRPDGAFAAGNEITTTAANAAITVSDYGQWVVRVEACNDAGCGPGVAQTVGVVLPKPGRPENLAVATKAGSLDVSADWDDVAWATSYAVHWGIVVPDMGVSWRVNARTSEASAAMPSAGKWAVKVEACNDAGCGADAMAMFQVDKAPEPTPPSPICDRTPAVRDTILSMIPREVDCAAVTEGQLAAITGDLRL